MWVTFVTRRGVANSHPSVATHDNGICSAVPHFIHESSDSMVQTSPRTTATRSNLHAACVTAMTFAVLYCSFDPVPAGENTNEPTTPPAIPNLAQLTEDSVPLPKTRNNEIRRDEEAVSPFEPKSQEVADVELKQTEPVKQVPTVRENYIAMLKDGIRMMESIDSYTVLFTKEERINGDLRSPQVLDMKVQHAPHFAVYMKWQNGEKGRQVLYSDDYEDGCLSLKFGGFKKILPALRVDPNCANAKAESRYPVTQAGVLNLSRKLLKSRESEGGRDDIEYRQLADSEFDGRPCNCFVVTWSEQCDTHPYRKHIVMIDKERNIPLVVRNFTWASDGEGLAGEALDNETLIENYSFSNLNLSSKLTAIEFSRDNPRYRM